MNVVPRTAGPEGPAYRELGILVGRSFRACLSKLVPDWTRLGSSFTGLVFLSLILTIVGPASAQTGPPTAEVDRPYADLQSKPYEYHGLGREKPEPENVETIRIGLFAPSRGLRAADGLSSTRGAELAIAQANAQGGLNGIPFELITRTDDSPWGSAHEVVRLVYEDHVWAIAGAIGGESTHVAQQIITKAHLPLIGTATTDASLTQINIGWMFRLMPDDDSVAHTMASHLIREKDYDTIVSITSTAYDHRLRAEAFEKDMARLGVPLALSLQFNPGDTDFSKQLTLIERSGADAVVVWGAPGEGAALVKALTAFEVFAGPGLDRAEFLRRAGTSAEGLTIVSLFDLGRNDPVLATFKQKFSAAFGMQPDVVAAFAYDGIRLVTEAIRNAGLNRAKIRDALAQTVAFDGVTGEIRFDGSGASTGQPVLLVVNEGKLRK